MRLDAETVHRARRNRRLTPGMRFALYRWVELMEPSNHFSLNASSLIDPLTSARELRDAVNGMAGNQGVRAGEVLSRSESLRKTVAMNGRLAQWYPQERNQLVHALKSAEQTTPSKQKKESFAAFEKRRRTVATQRFVPLVASELAAFDTSLTDPQSGYLSNLLSEIGTWLQQSPASLKEWRYLSRALEWLGAHALEQGRDAHLLSVGVALAFQRARSASDAVTDFTELFLEPQREFIVAVGVEGVRRITGARRFGCLPVVAAPTWPNGRAADNARLDQMRQDARASRGGSACVVLVRCDAWDAGHATRQALARVSSLADHVCAEHPATDVNLGRQTLVLDVQQRQVRETSATARSIDAARARRPNPELARSLRFYGMARQESVPVISILHTWIALEDLVAGTSFPGSFLPPAAAATVALSAAKAQLVTPYRELKFLARKNRQKSRWNEIESWLGVQRFGPAPPLDRWLDLVRLVPAANAPAASKLAPADDHNEAAAHLWELAGKLGPFAQYRLEELSERLNNSGSLTNWLGEVRDLSQMQLVRMRFLRHAAVHRARHHDEAAQELAVRPDHVVQLGEPSSGRLLG